MNLDLLRSFFVVLDAGSLNKAAARLHVSQSTLTRQIQALEHAVGGQLLERTSSGVVATATGQQLADGMGPVLERFETVLQDVQRFARGQRETLRIGYLASAAARFLNPALARLRQAHPEMKLQLLDLSPGEQIEGLRQAELDVALLGHAGPLLSREFYTRLIATLGVCVAMAETNRLTARDAVQLADLHEELFVGAPEADMPGHNQWVRQLCRRAGFRPQFVLNAESLSHGLSLLVTEGAVMLVPEYLAAAPAPGIAFRPLDDAEARWEIHVAWQRGKIAEAVKVLLQGLAGNPLLQTGTTSTG